MRDRDLYARILGIESPWTVQDVELHLSDGEVVVHVALERNANPKTARAWAIKEQSMSLWHYVHRTWATKGCQRWYDWAIRSRLEPVKKVSRMVKKHLWGIVNAMILNASNGLAESTNSRIQLIKIRSRGFRNKDRYQAAIFFHLGGLDLYLNTARALRTHTN